jgi:hypothetical protein
MCGADLSDLDEPVLESKKGSCPAKPIPKKDPNKDRPSDVIE